MDGVITQGQLSRVEFQQNNSKAIDICTRLEFFIPDEFWGKICHCAHDDVTLSVDGGALVGRGRTLTSQSKVRQLWNKLSIQQNISAE